MATVGAQEVLAAALRTNETLTELRLGGNGIGDPGAIALAEALTAQLSAKGSTIAVLPVECLAVCKRPCTIALSSEGSGFRATALSRTVVLEPTGHIACASAARCRLCLSDPQLQEARLRG